MSKRSFVDPSARRLARRLVSTAAAFDLAQTFRLLDDPTRIRILHALSIDELCVSALADLLATSQSAVSHQLRLLRDRRLVAVRREGRRSYYSLVDEHIRTLVDMGIAHVQEAPAPRKAGG